FKFLRANASRSSAPDHELVTRRICRNGRRRIGGDGNGRPRLQLKLTDGHYAIARLQPAGDFGATLEPSASTHESANGSQAGVAVVLFLLGDEENRISVERVID